MKAREARLLDYCNALPDIHGPLLAVNEDLVCCSGLILVVRVFREPHSQFHAIAIGAAVRCGQTF